MLKIQIPLHCHFVNIIKESGTKFQSSELNKKFVGGVCHGLHHPLAEFYFNRSNYSKDIIKKQLLIWTVYDDATGFGIWEFKKNIKTLTSSSVSNHVKIQILQKCYQNVQLLFLNPVKCPARPRISWKLLWSLTNGIQDLNNECWKITWIHLFVYLVKLLSNRYRYLSPEIFTIQATLRTGAWP